MRALGTVIGSVAALALAGGVLTGCTSDDKPPPSASSSPSSASVSPSASPVHLDVAVYGDEDKLGAYREIVDAFTAARSGKGPSTSAGPASALSGPPVDVRLTTYPDAGTAATKVADQLAAGSGPDVFLLDQTRLAGFVDTGDLQPVNGLLEDRDVQFGDDYQRVALTAFSANAGLQCMPAEMSPLVVYYDKDLLRRQAFTALGIDPTNPKAIWTWDEFASLAATAAAADGAGPIKGVALPADLPLLTALIRSAGGEVVDQADDPTTLALSSDDAVSTVRSVATLAQDSSVALTPAQLRAKAPLDWFTAGKVGLYVGTRADLPELRSTEGLRFDVLPLPAFGRSRAVSQISGWCLAADTPAEDAAADFIAFAVGDQAATIAASSGAMMPANLHALQSDTFLDPGQQPRTSGVYFESTKRTDPLPYSPAWPTVAATAEDALARIFRLSRLNVDGVLERRLAALDQQSLPLFANQPADGP